MNDFLVYEQLCKMSSISGQYPDGQQYSKKVRQIADRIASQLYRVAVIGEFKKGKSSLINALLGTQLLPTDIIPMTAVITHITYGETKKIIIKYKDGREEERTVEQLIDFATKYDKEKESTARTIKEIEVFYPSVFCKNHIELIDTPGMNDNEEMSAVTLGVLGDIDAAIMVISARAPLSITEQNLILTMIRERGIRHIVFVVTYIDLISDEPEEQDRLISYIGGRISGDLLKRAETEFADNEDLTLKARRILKDSDVFGVSSVQAMAGFVQDSEELLNLSRFPIFKKELLSLLTAAQTSDIGLNAADVLQDIKEKIDEWYLNEDKRLDDERLKIIKYQGRYNEYFKEDKGALIRMLREMDGRVQREIFSKGFSEIIAAVKKLFIKALASIRRENNTHENILSVLRSAMEKSYGIFEQSREELKKSVEDEMKTVYLNFKDLRPLYERSEQETQYPNILNRNLAQWHKNTEFPVYSWNRSPIPEIEDLTNVNVMPYIENTIILSAEKYGDDIKRYIASWRVILLRHNRMLSEDQKIFDTLQQHIEEITAEKNVLAANYKNHHAALDEISLRLSDFMT